MNHTATTYRIITRCRVGGRTARRRLLSLGLLLALCLGMLGACGRLGKELDRDFAPQGDPTLQAILADLAANDAAWRGFEGRGRAIVESPHLEAIQVLRQSDVIYRKPDALHVIGRRHGTTAFRLTGAGRAFLMEFPTERQYLLETTTAAGDYQRIGPIDLLHEMFQQEAWEHLPLERVYLDTFTDDNDKAGAVLELYGPEGHYPRRRLLLEATPDWVVRESQLVDSETGAVIAETRLNNYRLVDGVRFPAEIETEFPLHEARMEFAFSTITMNTDPEDALFDLEAQHMALEQRGFERVYPEPME